MGRFVWYRPGLLPVPVLDSYTGPESPNSLRLVPVQAPPVPVKTGSTAASHPPWCITSLTLAGCGLHHRAAAAGPGAALPLGPLRGLQPGDAGAAAGQAARDHPRDAERVARLPAQGAVLAPAVVAVVGGGVRANSAPSILASLYNSQSQNENTQKHGSISRYTNPVSILSAPIQTALKERSTLSPPLARSVCSFIV